MIHALLAFILQLQLAASESVTITRLPVFSSQRPCAQQCFDGGIGGVFTAAGALAYGIHCEYRNPQNECVCRPDLQDQAEAYLQNCVDNECNANSLDTNSAISIYDEYCTSAGYIRNVAATTTSGTNDSPLTVTATVTVTATSQPQQTFPTSKTSSSSSSNLVEDSSSSARPGETQTPAPTDSGSNDSNNENNNAGSSGGGSDENSNKGGGGGLGTSDVIGIVVGVLGFTATAIGTWFTYKSIRNKKRP
ncbi:hypothetical protein RRF57_007215 [Xylaria bambusicola]|uniref:Extracellular membrane protein CFEM domain-containing protein n=1 Tax=Xylaria bambusicola TaxID=326684 RepID=A0AAN7URM1_9PEZI